MLGIERIERNGEFGVGRRGNSEEGLERFEEGKGFSPLQPLCFVLGLCNFGSRLFSSLHLSGCSLSSSLCSRVIIVIILITTLSLSLCIYLIVDLHRRYELAQDYADDDDDKDAILKLRKRVLKRLNNQDALIRVTLNQLLLFLQPIL